MSKYKEQTKRTAIVAVDLGVKIIEQMVGDSIKLDSDADTAELMSIVINKELNSKMGDD